MNSSRRNKEIWFICKDAAPLSESGIFFRTFKQAQYFQRQGYVVKIICSNWVHGTTICHQTDGFWRSEIYEGIEYVFVKSVFYGQNNIKRLLSYVDFAAKIGKLLNYLDTPDVIVHTSRIPFDVRILSLKKKCNAKYIVDVSDLWPWELEHSKVLHKKNPILSLFYRIERYVYSRADHIVFSFEGGPDYIRDHKWDKQGHNGPIDMNKVHYVNTGLDYTEFVERLSRYSVDDKDLADRDSFKLVYLGSIRPANDVKQLIEAAKCLKSDHKIKILIYGDGPDREPLERMTETEGISNVIFKDKWVAPEYVPFILSNADLNLLNYEKGWAPYGGSMNKMFMAIASGKPVLCNAGMGYSPIRRFGIGIDQSFATPKEYADAILTFCKMDRGKYDILCENCKKAAEEFDCNKLIRHMEECCGL